MMVAAGSYFTRRKQTLEGWRDKPAIDELAAEAIWMEPIDRLLLRLATTAAGLDASVSIPIDQLVPGDIVELIAGDLVPADSRLLKSRDLFINQALLTGEPYPAKKQASDVPLGVESPA